MPALIRFDHPFRSLALSVFGLLLLAGCGAIHDSSSETLEQEQMKQDSSECQELGWEAHTPKYDECMEIKHKKRMEKEGRMPDSLLDGGWWIGTWF